MSSQVESKAVGTHQLALEEDIVFLTQIGDYTLADAQKVNGEVEGVLSRLGRVFVMVNQTRAGSTPPEVRRLLAEWNKKHRASGAVIFGGSATSRAVASLAVAAIRIFRPDGTPTAFAATESEARAWITAQRQKLPAAAR